VLSLYFGGRMSEPKMLEVLHTVGLQISAGELSCMLIKDQDVFHAESAAVLRAGLAVCRRDAGATFLSVMVDCIHE